MIFLRVLEMFVIDIELCGISGKYNFSQLFKHINHTDKENDDLRYFLFIIK